MSASIRFRPANQQDFSNFAKDLSWLLEEPLQKSQELLARIYGYSDLHEIQQEWGKNNVPGPYDEDLPLSGFDLNTKWVRDKRMLGLIAGAKKFQLEGLPTRYSDAREIGLFATPGTHRMAFRRIKGKYEVLMAGRISDAKILDDYAHLSTTEHGEVLAVFTPLGQGVFEAANSLILDPSQSHEETEWEHSEVELSKLIEEHPQNPWPFAILLSSFSERWWQGPWDSSAGINGGSMDADEGFQELATAFAKDLIGNVKKTIALFESLYHQQNSRLAPANFASARYSHGMDSYYYPAMLYWGGRVAQNAGETRLALQLFTKLYRDDARDGFGARFQIAVLKLNYGSSLRGLFNFKAGPEEEMTAWGRLAMAASAFERNDLAGARLHFAKSLSITWAAIEPFTGKLPDDERLNPHANINCPANIQEFMHLTRGYWSRIPSAKKYFTAIATDPSVRKAVSAFHRMNSELFGIELRGLSVSEMVSVENEAEILRDLLFEAVKVHD